MTNPGKIIGTIILIIIVLAVAGSLYPTFTEYIDNATGSGFTGTALLSVASVLYWIIISAVVLLSLIEGLGLSKMMKKFNRII
jgi:hypothetical protein